MKTLTVTYVCLILCSCGKINNNKNVSENTDIITFVNFDKNNYKVKNLTEKKFKSTGTNYRYIYRGFNLEGTCGNEECEAYNKRVWVRISDDKCKGYFRGEINENGTSIHTKFVNSINLTSIRHSCYCPICLEKVDRDSLINMGFYKCYYDITGIENKTTRCNNFNNKTDSSEGFIYFNSRQLGTKKFDSIEMVVRPLDWKEKKEAKLRAQQEKERQAAEERRRRIESDEKAERERIEKEEERRRRIQSDEKAAQERMEKEQERREKEEERKRRIKSDKQAAQERKEKEQERKEKEQERKEKEEERKRRIKSDKQAEQERKEKEEERNKRRKSDKIILEKDKEIEMLKKMLEQQSKMNNPVPMISSNVAKSVYLCNYNDSDSDSDSKNTINNEGVVIKENYINDNSPSIATGYDGYVQVDRK